MNNLSAKLVERFSGEEVPFRFIVSLVIPVIIDQFFLVSFNFINTAMISSSGPQAVSAVNLVGSLHFFLVQIFVAVGLGGTVLIAQYYGNRQYKQMGKMTAATVFGCLLMALLLSSLGLIFHDPLLHLLFGEAEPAVLANAKIYFIGLLISYPLQAVVEGTNGSLRGVGRTKASLKLSLLMNAFFIASNFLFVSSLGLGVLGLTYSLYISRGVALFFAIYTLFVNRSLLNIRKIYFQKPSFKNIRHVITVAIPFATEALAFNGGKIIVQMMIVSLGTNIIAANAISASWVQLSEIIPSALSTSLVPIVGRCIGAGKIADARNLAKSFILAGILAFLVVDLSLLPFFHLGVQVFNPPAEIVPLIFKIVVIYVVMHPIPWSISFILPSALRAAGDAKYTTIVSMCSMWIYRIGMGYIVGILLGFGLLGIAGVMTTEWLVRGIFFSLRFKGTKWYQNKLV